MTETKTALRQELRNLIVRNFGMKHCLKLSEIKELLNEIPEFEADVLRERMELKRQLQDKRDHSEDRIKLLLLQEKFIVGSDTSVDRWMERAFQVCIDEVLAVLGKETKKE